MSVYLHMNQVIAEVAAHTHALATSQLAKPTQKNRYGFKYSQKKASKESEREHQNMSVLALEILGEPCMMKHACGVS